MNDKTEPKHKPVAVWILIFLVGFLSLSGLAGGYGFISDPSGKEVGFPPETIHKLPFPDYLIPGFFLFFVYGVLGAITTCGLIRRSQWNWAVKIRFMQKIIPSWFMAIGLGEILTVWIVVQFILLGPPIAVIQIGYLVIGACISGVAMLPPVRRYYSSF